MTELLRNVSGRYSSIKENIKFIQNLLCGSNFENAVSDDIDMFFEIFNLQRGIHVVKKFKFRCIKDGEKIEQNFIILFNINKPEEKILLLNDENGISIQAKVEKREIFNINGIRQFDEVNVLRCQKENQSQCN
jgi:hypothetical protein